MDGALQVLAGRRPCGSVFVPGRLRRGAQAPQDLLGQTSTLLTLPHPLVRRSVSEGFVIGPLSPWVGTWYHLGCKRWHGLCLLTSPERLLEVTRIITPHYVASVLPAYVWARLGPGADPIQGIADLIGEMGADSGSIVQCMGSLKRAKFVIAVPAGDTGWRFSDI